MKRILYILIIGVLIANDEIKFPGGYIGFSINYGFQNSIGSQISIGIALPFIDEPSSGTYLFPGIASGFRYSINNKSKYLYTDTQLVLRYQGLWCGLAKGIQFNEHNNINRNKLFSGFLGFGYILEKTALLNKNKYYKGIHLGIVAPLIGNHFYP